MLVSAPQSAASSTSIPVAASAVPSDAPAICPQVTDSIVRLYSAYFRRAPEADGFAFWVNEFSSGRRDLVEMSDFFSRSDEFRSLYDNLDDRQFVGLIYRNVLGRIGDDEGLDFWSKELASGSMSRGTVLLNFSESPEYVARTGTAPPLAGYFNWYPEGARFSCGAGDLTHGTLGHDTVDVLAFIGPGINPPQPPPFHTYLGASSVLLVSGSGLLHEDMLVLDQLTPSFEPEQDQHIRIETEPTVFSYIVSYDGKNTPAFAERAGWRTGERAVTVAEFERDISEAVVVVDAFWATHGSDIIDGPVTAPTITGTYDGSRPEAAPRCGSITLGKNNAFYCPVDDSVAWDASLMADGYTIGDGFVYLVVAHEWGHAIQARIDEDEVNVASELQADCFAGAALFGAVEPGSPSPGELQGLQATESSHLKFEAGDIEELAATLTEIADDRPWTNTFSHGNAEERIDSFRVGAAGGPAACLSKSGFGRSGN